jgi:hypothetical protein
MTHKVIYVKVGEFGFIGKKYDKFPLCKCTKFNPIDLVDDMEQVDCDKCKRIYKKSTKGIK